MGTRPGKHDQSQAPYPGLRVSLGLDPRGLLHQVREEPLGEKIAHMIQYRNSQSQNLPPKTWMTRPGQKAMSKTIPETVQSDEQNHEDRLALL